MNKDYYNTLGVNKNASKEDIKKAFYKLAHKYHPDKKGGNEPKFKEVNEAYQILSDDAKRSKYDQFGSQFESAGGGYRQGAGGGFGGFDFSQGFGGFSAQGEDFGNLNDIFSDFFGGGMGGFYTRNPRGRDMQTEIHISLTDSILGTEKNIIISDARTGKTLQFVNTNLFASLPNFIGGKTGTIPEAVGNLISMFSIEALDSQGIVIILLGSENRFIETQKILNLYGRRS